MDVQITEADFTIVSLITDYGFPTVMVVGLGYFVYFVWQFINNNIEPEIEKMHFQLIKVIDQMRMLDEDLIRLQQKIDVVLKLSVSLETIKKRILERQIKEDRADDSEEIAIKRYKTYEKSAEPVIDYYKQSNLLKFINGEAGISEISSEISVLIDTIKG